MFFRHHTDKLIYPLLVVVLLMVVSYRPTYHLRREMPDSFFTSSASDSTQKRALDKKRLRQPTGKVRRGMSSGDTPMDIRCRQRHPQNSMLTRER